VRAFALVATAPTLVAVAQIQRHGLSSMSTTPCLPSTPESSEDPDSSDLSELSSSDEEDEMPAKSGRSIETSHPTFSDAVPDMLTVRSEVLPSTTPVPRPAGSLPRYTSPVLSSQETITLDISTGEGTHDLLLVHPNAAPMQTD
jgi:hypothetical protein